MWLVAPEVSVDYYCSSPWNCKSFNAYNHIHTGNDTYIYIHRINNYTAHNFYRIMVTATSVVGVIEMDNIVPSAGIEHTSLAFCQCANHYTT